MDYQIKTIYCREDIEGFYNAFLSEKKLYRMTKKNNQYFMTAFACVFWGIPALNIISFLINGEFRLVLEILPGTIVLVIIGSLFFWLGNKKLRSRATWKSYPYRGQELTFCFTSDGFTQMQRNLETKITYPGIVRLYEDKSCFYLFITSKNAYILPKRSFASEANVDSFRSYITNATGLAMEHD